MGTTGAWMFVLFFWLLPLAHVAASPRGGPWRPPPGARCPFGPRVGWLIMVLLLGAVGWLMFFHAKVWRAPPHAQERDGRREALKRDL